MRKNTYYPGAKGDQIEWNINITLELPNYASELGISPGELQGILDDCNMQVFLLTHVGELADSTYATLHGYADVMANAPLNSAAISLPELPKWPSKMPTAVLPGIGARRAAWVNRAKNSPGYHAKTNGRALRLEPPGNSFAPEAYVAQLKSVVAIAHERVQVQILKGGGEVTAARLMMRRKGEAFALVAQFTNRSMIDTTPLKEANTPEIREYQLIALKNDKVIGQPSPIWTVTVS